MVEAHDKSDDNWRILDAMKGMIDEVRGPKTKFKFQGIDSGLEMPEILKWPAPKGFSFCTWICVEELSNPKWWTWTSLETNGCIVLVSYP